MGKKVAILQSNYLPWKGYFDIINSVDEFIFYDDVQFTKNDWRNRTKIKTHQGVKWLSIPCGPDINRLICDVEISDSHWQKKHWKTIVQCYGKAKFFNMYEEFFEDFYLNREWRFLWQLNQYLITHISRDFLDIKTKFTDSREKKLQGKKGERLIDLIKQTQATDYVSGPAAKDYLDEQTLSDIGVKVHWMDYSGYPEYSQLYEDFVHNVSIIDLLFCEGSAATYYMKSFNHEK